MSSPFTQGHGCLEAHEATRAFLVPEKGPSPDKLLSILYQKWFPFFFFSLTCSIVVYVQVIQEVFVAEEKDTQNEAMVEANLCAKANRALGAAE